MTEPTEPPPAVPAGPTDPAEAARLAGRAVLAERGTPGLQYRLRVELRLPVSRGDRSDEAVIAVRELDTDTTDILTARAGYDALTRELPTAAGGADPAAALLELAAARRHPALIEIAALADQYTGARVVLSLVGRHPAWPPRRPAEGKIRRRLGGEP